MKRIYLARNGPLTDGEKASAEGTFELRRERRPLFRSLWPWLAAAIALRLALAPFTSHPFDMTAWMTIQDRAFDGGLNPLWNWKFSVPLLSLVLLTWPLAAVTALLPGVPFVLAQQFWIKMPFILADAGIAILLARYVTVATQSRSRGRLAGIVWLLSPVGLFFTAVHGQFDALPALFIVGSLVFSQRGDEDKAFASLLLAGVAKFVGFALLPIFLAWLWSQRPSPTIRWLRVLLTAVGIFLLAFPTLLHPWLRRDLLSGIASERATGDTASDWSIWSFGLVPTSWPKWIWLLLSIGALVLVVWRVGRAHIHDPHVLPRAFLTILAVAVASDPLGNPQFVVFLMPLIILISFVDDRPFLLALGSLVGLFCLLGWKSENLLIWWLNAVPDINLLHVFPSATGWISANTARLAGFGYSSLLLVIAIVVQRRPRGRKHLGMDSEALFRIGAVSALGGLLLGLGLLAYTFQPVLIPRYSSAPENAPFIDAQNSLLPEEVEIPRGGSSVLVAKWNERDKRFLSGHVDRARLEITATRPVSPALSATQRGRAMLVSEAGLQQRFTLERSAARVSVQLLLHNSRFGMAGGPNLPEFVLYGYQERGFPEALPVQVSALGTDVSGWYLIRIDQSGTEMPISYVLDLRDMNSEGWLWDGGGPAQERIQALRGWAKLPRSHWMQVSTVPLVYPSLFGSTSDTELSLTPDYRLRLSSRIASRADIGRLRVLLPRIEEFSRPNDIRLVLDLRSDPAWRRKPGSLITLWLSAVLYVFLFLALTRKAARWALVSLRRVPQRDRFGF